MERKRMSQTIPAGNPFLLMIEPEAIFARIEKSERLSQLNRQVCRPLDRPTPGTTASPDDADPGFIAAAVVAPIPAEEELADAFAA
jgi:hypothetical protein